MEIISKMRLKMRNCNFSTNGIALKLLYIYNSLLFYLRINNRSKMVISQTIQNYFYDFFPYLRNMPIPYPHQVQPSNTTQEKIITDPASIKQDPVESELKIQAKQADYLIVKQEPKDSQDEQPHKKQSSSKKTEKDSFTEKRNIVPNNINHILAFVQRKSKSQKVVKTVINRYKGNEKYTAKRFYCYQGHLKERLHVHVNKESLKKLMNYSDAGSQIFTVEEQLFYNRICRILMYYYLRSMAMLTILSSGRVKQTNKKDHLQAQRDLKEYLLNCDQQ